jgi:hypothetical protein
MPKRSNEFQKLVFTVKKHVVESAVVTESKFLNDRLTGTPREVDVCIETSVDDHPVVISIECRDQRRPVPVGWVEEMRTKHDRLSTTTLALVSRTGFTKEAAKVAQKYGIQLLRFSQVTGDQVQALLEGSSSLFGKTFQVTAAKVSAYVEALDELASETVVLLPSNYLFSAQGELLGTVRQLVEAFLHSGEVGKRLGRDGNESHKWFEIEWVPTAGEDQRGIYLEKTEPRVLRRVEWIRVAGPCSFRISEFRLQRGQLGSVEVAWGTGTLFGMGTTLIASKSAAGGQKLTVAFNQNAQLSEGVPSRHRSTRNRRQED